MVVRIRFIFLVLMGVAISEMSAGPQESAINQPATTNNVRIVGGELAKLGEFPHQLFMEFKSQETGNEFFKCGASILYSRWAITAAHCVYGFERKPELFTLHAGHLSRSKNMTGSEKAYKVIRIAVHPEYSYETRANDIALMRIKGSFEFSNPIVQPANILMKPQVLIGETAIVSGWGRTESSGMWDDSVPESDILLKAELVILPFHECKSHYIGTTLDSTTQICARGIEQGACKGDSGGPLEINGAVVGIASFVDRFGCGSGYPEVYTRVSAFKQWMEEVTSSG